jgi:hypothetical protein
MSAVFEKAFGAHLPDQKCLEELDKKIKNFSIPPSLQIPGFGSTKLDGMSKQSHAGLTMQRHTAAAIKEISPWYEWASTVFASETLVLQLCSTCTEISSREQWKIIPTILWPVNIALLY